MLSESQVDAFARDGFLNGGPALGEADLTELTDELERVLAVGPEGFTGDQPRPVLFRNMTDDNATPVWQIVNIWEASKPFWRLMHHPFIVRGIAQLAGFGDLQIWHDQVQYKPAGAGGSTRWHQDAPLWTTIAPMTEVSAWIPFDDADLDNGCMWMVPGSHRWGDRMDYLETQGHREQLPDFGDVGEDFVSPQGAKVQAVACPVKRGEVHFHHALTWHGSPRNQSTRPRRALAIHFMTPETRFTGEDHPMRQFISVEPGESMRDAGDHFPMLCRDGEPVGY